MTYERNKPRCHKKEKTITDAIAFICLFLGAMGGMAWGLLLAHLTA